MSVPSTNDRTVIDIVVESCASHDGRLSAAEEYISPATYITTHYIIYIVINTGILTRCLGMHSKFMAGIFILCRFFDARLPVSKCCCIYLHVITLILINERADMCTARTVVEHVIVE